MKKGIFLLAVLFASTAVSAQTVSRFSCAVSLGTGIALNQPASTPFVWRLTGYYEVTPRFFAGAGTGLSFYEKTLVPVYAEARFSLTRPRRLTPYAACAGGYAFAVQEGVNGGLLLNPAIGVQCALRGSCRLFVQAGYEVQRLERLRRYDGPLLSAQFAEKLSHGTILLHVGLLF